MMTEVKEEMQAEKKEKEEAEDVEKKMTEVKEEMQAEKKEEDVKDGCFGWSCGLFTIISDSFKPWVQTKMTEVKEEMQAEKKEEAEDVEGSQMEKKKIRMFKRKMTRPLSLPNLNDPANAPLPLPLPEYGSDTLISWWDIENVSMPTWLKAEDALSTIRSSLLNLGYTQAETMKICVVVKTSTEDTVPLGTQRKFAVLKKDPGFTFTDCKADLDKEYEEGQLDIADDEILDQILDFLQLPNTSGTVVLFTGDFKILSVCKELKRRKFNVIVVPQTIKGLKKGLYDILVGLGVLVIEWPCFLSYSHH